MITISLNEIWAHNPCQLGWEKLLAHLGKTKADDERFPFATILDSNGLNDAIWAFRCLKDQTPARLFAVACAQDVAHLMQDARSMDAIKVAHMYAHGEADGDEQAAARAAAQAAARDAVWADSWDAAQAAALTAAWAAAQAAALTAAQAARCARDVMHKKQIDWLIAIVENYTEE